MTFTMESSDFYKFYYAKLQENIVPDEKNTSESPLTIYLNLGFSVWHYMLITLINFTVTLCVFPAVTVLVESYNSDPEGKYDFKKMKAERAFHIFINHYI